MNILHSLRFRITLWYALVLALLLLIFSAVMLLLLSGSLNRQLDEEIKLRAGHLAETLAAGNAGLDTGGIGGFQLRPDELAVVFDAAGGRADVAGLALREGDIDPLVAQTLNNFITYFTSVTENGTRVRVLMMPVKRDSIILGALAFGRSTADVDAVLAAVRNLAFAATAVIILLAGAGGFFLTGRALTPMGAINRTAREIGEGGLGRRITVTDGGEIGSLAGTLNRMFDRLETSFAREKRFTSDASHELRTPLAIIEAEATLALAKNRPAEDYKKSLEVVAQEAGHMSSLINDLLFLARSDAGTEKLALKPVALGSFMGELVSDISVLSLAKNLTLKFTELADPVVDADQTRLRQLFLNLLENAIRYTQPGGVITVSVDRRDGQARATVADTGAGIPAEALGHIFEPFYRADPGRARAEGGTGLGLAIGQRIAEAHGGKVTVESAPGRGSAFYVALPLSAGDKAGEAASKKPTRVFARRRFSLWPWR